MTNSVQSMQPNHKDTSTAAVQPGRVFVSSGEGSKPK